MNLFKERSAKLGRLAAQVKSVLDLDCPIGSDIFQDLILFLVVPGENIRVCAQKSDRGRARDENIADRPCNL